MKPPLSRTLSAVPRLPHVQLEIAKAIRALAGQDEDEQLRQRRAEVAAICRECEEIKRDIGKIARLLASTIRSDLQKFIDARRSPTVEKAGFRSDQPRWPTGSGEISGRWSGGAGVADPSPPKTPTEEPPPRSWSIGHNQGPPLDDPPEIPLESPLTEHEILDVAKTAARWLARAGVRPALEATAEAISGPVGDFLLVLEATYWLARALPSIYSYLDPPKTLEELQKNPKKGYDEHHNVEQWSEKDDIPRSLIDADENRVRIPRMRHWEMNGWLDTPDKEFGDAQLNEMSPRDYLKGKSWEERYRFGLGALKKFNVLKP
jgi:hypothetical protein